MGRHSAAEPHWPGSPSSLTSPVFHFCTTKRNITFLAATAPGYKHCIGSLTLEYLHYSILYGGPGMCISRSLPALVNSSKLELTIVASALQLHSDVALDLKVLRCSNSSPPLASQNLYLQCMLFLRSLAFYIADLFWPGGTKAFSLCYPSAFCCFYFCPCPIGACKTPLVICLAHGEDEE